MLEVPAPLMGPHPPLREILDLPLIWAPTFFFMGTNFLDILRILIDFR